MVVPVFNPLMRQQISQRSLRRSIFQGMPRFIYANPSFRSRSIYRFPERSKVPDFKTFSSLLRMTAKYEIPTVRSQLLEIIRDAYPATFGALTPTKPLGEAVFPGPNPHPNEVLGLFIQQELTPALPMAYYMAVRRGVDSFMDRHLPQSATLSPEVLQFAMKGLMALRELELNEVHNLVLGSGTSHRCSSAKCSSRKPMGPGVSNAHRKVIDRITASSRSGTKVLEVLSLSGDDSAGFCESCVKGWEDGHVEVRRRAWDMLSNVFGLKG